jgi:hypothetical protein
MKDRTYVTADAVPTARPTIPMPGQLPVEHYDNLLKRRVTLPLSRQAVGTPVTATGRITKIRPLDSDARRVAIVLTDDDGHSAIVTFAAGSVARIAPLLREGTRITLSGLVTRTAPTLPVGIDGFNAQMADA